MTVVLLLGVTVRLARAVHAIPPPTPAQERALDAQIARVDSARAAGRGARSAGRGSAARGATGRGAEGRGSAASGSRGRGTARPASAAQPSPRPLVDLETATAAEIEALPYIGPALAERIISSRTRCGPFGSLDGLKRVYGIGDGVAKRLAPYVTFSVASSPSSAARPPGCAGADAHAALRQHDRP